MDPNERDEAGFRRRWSWKVGSFAESARRWLDRIAKRLKYPALASVPVSAAMLSRVDSVSPDQALDEVAQLFTAGASQLPVMDHGVAVGIVTRDAVALSLRESGPHALIGATPCRTFVTVAPSDDLGEVLAQLRATPDAVALVVDRGAPLGVVTADMLVAYEARQPV